MAWSTRQNQNFLHPDIQRAKDVADSLLTRLQPRENVEHPVGSSILDYGKTIALIIVSCAEPHTDFFLSLLNLGKGLKDVRRIHRNITRGNDILSYIEQDFNNPLGRLDDVGNSEFPTLDVNTQYNDASNCNFETPSVQSEQLQNGNNTYDSMKDHIEMEQNGYLSAMIMLAALGDLAISAWNLWNTKNKLSNMKVDGKNLEMLSEDLLSIEERLDTTWNKTCTVINRYLQGTIAYGYDLTDLAHEYRYIEADLKECESRLRLMKVQVDSQAAKHWKSYLNSTMSGIVSGVRVLTVSQSAMYARLGTLSATCLWAAPVVFLVAGGVYYITYKKYQRKQDKIGNQLTRAKELRRQLHNTVKDYKTQLVRVEQMYYNRQHHHQTSRRRARAAMM